MQIRKNRRDHRSDIARILGLHRFAVTKVLRRYDDLLPNDVELLSAAERFCRDRGGAWYCNDFVHENNRLHIVDVYKWRDRMLRLGYIQKVGTKGRGWGNSDSWENTGKAGMALAMYSRTIIATL